LESLSLIHVHQDRMIGTSACDHRRDIGAMNPDPWFLKQATVDLAKEAPVPVDDFGQQLSDIDHGVVWAELEHPPESEAEPQPADQDARLSGRDSGASEFGHLALGRRSGGAHQLHAIHPQIIVSVVLLEQQLRAIGRAAGGKGGGRFHPAGFKLYPRRPDRCE
jgi:hypothetical protein